MRSFQAQLPNICLFQPPRLVCYFAFYSCEQNIFGDLEEAIHWKALPKALENQIKTIICGFILMEIIISSNKHMFFLLSTVGNCTVFDLSD